MKKILIVTDAWEQTNGVITTYINIINELETRGYNVKVISPNLFKTIPLPSYKEIRLSINPWKVSKYIEDEAPDYIHIATEGSLGLFATQYCNKKGYNYTTSYHTKYPEYINKRLKFIKPSFVYKYMRYFHKNSNKILVTTQSMIDELIENGFDKHKLILWNKGVDTSVFNREGRTLSSILRLTYIGRVSTEKNIEAFLDMPITALKTVVGDGPDLNRLKKKYKNDRFIRFVGKRNGKELQSYYVNSEYLVFPSKTDTFGLVMLEANACGTPVIAYPVTGPIDFIVNGVNGYMDDNLMVALIEANSRIDREKVYEYSKNYTWEKATDTFLDNLENNLIDRR